MPYFPGIRRVNLQKWRKVMGEGVDVKFGKNLNNVTTDEDGRVTAHFADGTSETGKCFDWDRWRGFYCQEDPIRVASSRSRGAAI